MTGEGVFCHTVVKTFVGFGDVTDGEVLCGGNGGLPVVSCISVPVEAFSRGVAKATTHQDDRVSFCYAGGTDIVQNSGVFRRNCGKMIKTFTSRKTWLTHSVE